MTECPTYTAQIYIAGDMAQARRLCAQRFIEKGLCVTLEPVEYVYAGGCEAGMRVGIINYPRFPAEPEAIFAEALDLARALRAELGQWSFSIVATDRTVFESVRPAESGAGDRPGLTAEDGRLRDQANPNQRADQ